MDPKQRTTGLHFIITPDDLERIRALRGERRVEARIARAHRDVKPYLTNPLEPYDGSNEHNTRKTLPYHRAMQDMAMLYLVTGEERYAQACRRDLLTYVKVERQYGRLSGASLEEGDMKRTFLFVNEWLSDFFSDEERRGLRDLAIRSIPRHAHEMARFTIRGWSIQNHLQHDAMGMAFAALYYNDFLQADRWGKLATDICIQYAQEAFFPDGAQNELATSYHAGCVEEVVLLGHLMRDFGGRDLWSESWYREVLERSIEWMGSLVTAGGGAVAFNDSRDTCESWYFRLAASRFGNEHCQALADHLDDTNGGHDHDPARVYDPHPTLISDLMYYDPGVRSRFNNATRYYFPHATTTAFRDGYGAEGGLLAQKAGAYHGGHSQADRLGFEYWHKGEQLLRDLGGQRINDWPIFRAYYRQCAAHTVVAIHEPSEMAFEAKYKDGEHILQVDHRPHRRAKGKYHHVSDHDDVASTMANAEIYDGIMQQRTLVWLKNSGVLILRDRVSSEKEHPFEQLFQGCGELSPGQGSFEFAGPRWSFKASVLAPEDVTVHARKAPEGGVGSSAYAAVARHGKTVEFLTVLEPYKKEAPATRTLDDAGQLKFIAAGDEILIASGDGRLTVQLNDRTVFADATDR